MTATELIELRGWRIDPTAGVVYGVRGRPIGSPDSSGYLQVDGRTRGEGIEQVARLVWEAVNGPVSDGKQINHINGIKTDNRIANLELATPSENIRHAYRTGLKSNRGVKHPCARLSDEAVRRIRRLRAEGTAINDIAAEIGVHRRTVTDVLLGRTWTHVEGM